MEKYLNISLPIRERVNDLLSRMTLDEKIAQCRQDLYGWKCYSNNNGKISTSSYLEVYLDKTPGIGCLYGLFRADPWSQINQDNGIPEKQSHQVANLIQEKIMESNRWHIPALFTEEVSHGHQALGGISYPTNIGRGNSFDSKLIEQSSFLQSSELRAKGVHLALVSALDLARDPRWGRTEESFGEDPVLASKYTRSLIRGFQGGLIKHESDFLDDPVDLTNNSRTGVVLKHLIGQGDMLGGHNSGTTIIGKRELMDIYSPLLAASQDAVGVMAAYNDIDGVPCHANPELLREMLRKQHKFQGMIMADGTALDRLVPLYGSHHKAAAKAMTAGIQMSLWDKTYPHLASAVKEGLLPESFIDDAAFRVLAIKYLLGVMDDPFGSKTTFNRKQADVTNLKLAKESLTLVKNESGILPLKDNQTISVIGPNANSIYNLLGDYTAPQDGAKNTTIYAAIKRNFPNSNVSFNIGCEIRNTENQQGSIREAVKSAAKSNIIILVLGGSSTRNFKQKFMNNGAATNPAINMDTGENIDIASLKLGGMQEELLKQLSDLNIPIITIMIQGRPYSLTNILKYSSAVLIGWYPGQQGGNAIAQLLHGDFNPSGRLSLTYPVSADQLPVYYNQRISEHPAYFDQPTDIQFPIGFGLRFHYLSPISELHISPSRITTADLETGKKVNVSLTVKNTSPQIDNASEICFIKGTTGIIIPRKKQIADFQRVTCKPQQTATYNFSFDQSVLRQFGPDNKWHLFQGKVEVWVGKMHGEFIIV